MRNQYRVRTALSGLALFILINVMPGRAAADELSSATDTGMVGDATTSATVQSLQQSFVQHQELLATQAKQLEQQQQQIREQREQLQTMENQLAQLVAGQSVPMEPAADQAEQSESDGSGEIVSQQTVATLRSEPEDPTENLPYTLPGYLDIPGTSLSMKIGGYVKMSIVQSFDPVGSPDRFIVGLIPVTGDEAGVESQASLSVGQSRLNLDVRGNSPLGPLRAFIEGDFAGSGDTFRLRHAYGQFRKVLAGKTWSTFVDSQAVPDDIDFEGLNGRINERQAQLRYFPSIGEHLDLAVAIEDPNPDVTGGTGLTKVPDVVAAIRRTWLNRVHVRSSLLLRKISARPDTNPDVTDTVGGWGLSLSGRLNVPRWGKADNLLFQLNYGDGIGRYINDLGTVGGQDAVFDPVTGKLKALPAFGGYVSFQHWWSEKMRSTFVVGYTEVDNFDFQPGDAYHETRRVTANLLFSPIPRVDVGVELLWGERTNKDGNTGDATQLQFAARYIF